MGDCKNRHRGSCPRIFFAALQSLTKSLANKGEAKYSSDEAGEANICRTRETGVPASPEPSD
jgi:hypothetical protein